MKRYLFLYLFMYLWVNPLIGQSENVIIPQHEETLQQLPDSAHHDAYDTLIEHVTTDADNDAFHTKFLNMLFILALMIGFMILASWMLKRMMKTRVTQLNTSSSIKILETRSLSPKATLYLIDVMGETLLIGESHMGVSRIASFHDFANVPDETQKPNLD